MSLQRVRAPSLHLDRHPITALPLLNLDDYSLAQGVTLKSAGRPYPLPEPDSLPGLPGPPGQHQRVVLLAPLRPGCRPTRSPAGKEAMRSAAGREGPGRTALTAGCWLGRPAWEPRRTRSRSQSRSRPRAFHLTPGPVLRRRLRTSRPTLGPAPGTCARAGPVPGLAGSRQLGGEEWGDVCTHPSSTTATARPARGPPAPCSATARPSAPPGPAPSAHGRALAALPASPLAAPPRLPAPVAQGGVRSLTAASCGASLSCPAAGQGGELSCQSLSPTGRPLGR